MKMHMKLLNVCWHYAILALFLSMFTKSYGKDIFTLTPQRDAESIVIPVSQTYANNYAISMHASRHKLCGLCINGKIFDMDEDYLVRVLLKDKKGKEYVVLESYRELNNSSMLALEDYCEETALLPDVEPDSMIVYVHNATFHIDNIVTVCASERARNDTSYIKSQSKKIKQMQVENKAERINRYNKSHKKLWFASVTDLCMADFSTRMKQLGFKESQSTGGLEYYIGGIFEMGDPIFRGPPYYSPYVGSFDWRNRHGRNWMTSVKNQGGSNYCSAFSSASVLEALANLYFNNILN